MEEERERVPSEMDDELDVAREVGDFAVFLESMGPRTRET